MKTQPSVTALLRSWWHGLRSGPRRTARPAGLGLDGLPHGVGRLPAGAPAALLVQDEACWQDWPPALVADLLAAGPVLALAAQAGDIDALLRMPALAQAHAAGRLRTWLLPSEAQARLRRDGLGALAQELARNGLGPHTSLCVLDAHAMLAGATVAELQRLAGQWRRWSAARRRPVALLLPLHRAQAEGGNDLGAAVRAQAAFRHVAELGTLSGRPVLTLYRWDGGQGAVFDARYDLRRDGGRLCYDGSFSLGAQPVLADAPDQFAVHATRASVAGQRGVPATWQIADSLAALEEAARGAAGATVLIDAGVPEQFAAVAALVHRLRQARPRSLKIIVRETESKLRAHSEQALLRLGVTSVVYREVGFARLQKLIEDGRHLVYAGAIESDCAQTLAACMPAAARGYQRPARFVQLAGDMLARTEAAGLSHCLVRLQLLPTVAHLDALRACRVQRDGDLVTADAQGLYVFLFACRESDLDLALSHLFTLPLGALFSSQAQDATAGGMALVLERLRGAAAHLPDYGPLLEPVAAPAPREAQPAAGAGGGAALLPVVVAVPEEAPHRGAAAVQVSARPIGRRPVREEVAA